MAKQENKSIVTMTTAVGLTGQINIFGLGSDNRVYFWDAKACGWRPNWEQAQPIADPAKLKKVTTKSRR